MCVSSHIRTDILHATLNRDIVKKDEYRGFDYIAVADVIAILNQKFSNKWDFEIVNSWEQPILDIDILVNVHGRMTIHGMGTKEQISTGSFRQHCLKISGKGKKLSDLNMVDIIDVNLDMVYKTAVSDCIKKLASYFHVAEELYGGSVVPLLESDELTADQVKRINKMKTTLGEEKFALLLSSWCDENGPVKKSTFATFRTFIGKNM